MVYDPVTELWSVGPAVQKALYYHCAVNLRENGPEIFILSHVQTTPHLYNFDTAADPQPIIGNFRQLPRAYPR